MIRKVQVHKDLDDLFPGPAGDTPDNDPRWIGFLLRLVESSFAAEQGLPRRQAEHPPRHRRPPCREEQTQTGPAYSHRSRLGTR